MRVRNADVRSAFPVRPQKSASIFPVAVRIREVAGIEPERIPVQKPKQTDSVEKQNGRPGKKIGRNSPCFRRYVLIDEKTDQTVTPISSECLRAFPDRSASLHRILTKNRKQPSESGYRKRHAVKPFFSRLSASHQPFPPSRQHTVRFRRSLFSEESEGRA